MTWGLNNSHLNSVQRTLVLPVQLREHSPLNTPCNQLPSALPHPVHSTSLSAWHSDRHSLADYLVDESINKGVNIFFTLLLNLTCTNFQQRQHLSLEFLKFYLKFYQYRKNNFFNGQILKIQIVQRYLRNIVYVMTGNCFFSCF